MLEDKDVDEALLDVVERCLRRLLGLELVLRWSSLHEEKRWTICPLMFSPSSEHTASISCCYGRHLALDGKAKRRCNVRFKSRKEAVEEILTRIFDFSWHWFDDVALFTLKNPLLGKTTVEELEMLLGLNGDKGHV